MSLFSVVMKLALGLPVNPLSDLLKYNLIAYIHQNDIICDIVWNN